jgi:orotidine-5'-phosphate decarboxylase
MRENGAVSDFASRFAMARSGPGPLVWGLDPSAALLKAGEIGDLNRTLAPGQIGPVGAVVGPTRIEPELDLAGAQALFLAPGVGAQGATAEDVARVFAACPARVMPSASRSLLAVGPDIKALQDRAAAMAAEFRRLLPASKDATARTI